MTMQKTRKITFSLPAEIVADASSGLLLGEFNNWNKEQGFSLKKSKDGSMKTTVELEAGKSYEYRYLLDGGRWVNDLNATAYTEVSSLGVLNCVVNVPAEVVAEAKPAKKAAEKKVKIEKVDTAEKTEAKPVAKRATAKKTAK
jgi:1,4-alpha-glucan branching enzyme